MCYVLGLVLTGHIQNIFMFLVVSSSIVHLNYHMIEEASKIISFRYGPLPDWQIAKQAVATTSSTKVQK